MNNIWGDAVFKLAFPEFDPHVWTTQEMNEARARAPKKLDHLILLTDKYRRWGGLDLPRGRYYSVAIDEKGRDGGTLVAELRAYRNRKEQGMIVDALDAVQVPWLKNYPMPDEIKDVLDACVVVSIFPATRLRQSVEALQSRELYRPGRESQLALLDDHTVVWVLLMPVVKRAQIPDVVDLRLPETRRYFFKLFKTGEELTLEGQAFQRINGTNITEFLGMLPDLIAPELGGVEADPCGVTQALGGYLRAAGVNGIVYPSARTDCGAKIVQGDLRFCYGWNFIDYRGAGTPLMKHFYALDPWFQKTLKGVEVHHCVDGENAGSFWTIGVHDANGQLYEDSFEQERRGLLERVKRRQGIRAYVLTGSTSLDALDPRPRYKPPAMARLKSQIRFMMSRIRRV